MTGQTVLEEHFTAFNYANAHTDIALAVYISKRIEFIIRIYFCDSIDLMRKTTLGPLIKYYSSVEERCPKNVRLNIQLLVKKRNDFVHKINVNKFESKSDRKEFLYISNLVLSELKKAALTPFNWERYKQRYEMILSNFTFVEEGHSEPPPRFVIKIPGDNASTEELLNFHCWNMIKKDLQKFISSEDEEGLFEDLLPTNMEDYVSAQTLK